LPFAGLLVIGIVEYVQISGKMGWPIPVWLMAPIAAAQWLAPDSVLAQLLPAFEPTAALEGPVFLGGMFAALAYSLWLYERRPETNAAGVLMASITGLVLLGWLGSHFFRLRGLGDMAAEWTALAMVTNWTADSGGYVFGTTLGRRRLSPRLSPNKTVEGYLGGLAAGILAAAIVALLLDLALNLAIFLGILISALGPAGDLGISLLKRSVGLKDSGSFLPGHGGALDRTDSLLWAVALTYYVVLLVA
jgi:phosphatidate cytidylyltransferase